MTELANFSKVKHKFEENTVIPGYYTLHRPSQCNLKFPKDNRPIHRKLKNAYEGKETIEVLQNGKLRHILIPKRDKITYPTITHKNEYEKLKLCLLEGKKVAKTTVDRIELKKTTLEQSEKLKEEFKAKQKPQPGISTEKVENKPEQDVKAHTKKRAICLQNEEFQGARIANQVILASKCHAIRDAQINEKLIISQQLVEENKRMDEIMEKARIAALEIEQKQYNERKAKRLDNLNSIKKQIAQHELARAAELKYIDKECGRLNQSGIAVLLDDSEKLSKKRENAHRLKELLDKCNKELLDCKQKQLEEDKIMEERIKKFVHYRRERDTKIKAETSAKKAARERGIFFIAKEQETAKKYREEMENIRILKIHEDVEREYREKEKANSIKKANELKKLKEAREKQIADVRRRIAMEVSKDEEVLRSIAKRNEEDKLKEEMRLKIKQDALKNHRQSIIKQINEKERKRIEMKKRIVEEGLATKFELERLENLEKTVVKQKVDEMREQKIPEAYINEVEHRLTKLKIY